MMEYHLEWKKGKDGARDHQRLAMEYNYPPLTSQAQSSKLKPNLSSCQNIHKLCEKKLLVYVRQNYKR